MPPIIRNTLIRLLGFFSQIWRGLTTVLGQTFGFLAKILGLTAASVSLEGDDARSYQLPNATPSATEQSQQATAKSSSAATAETTFAPKSVAQGDRRRPDPNLDYFRKMARETAANRHNANG